MPLLKFTLSEEGVGTLRDVLACLNKFGEEVSLEATKDKALLSLFRARSGDPLHEHDKDTTIERCDVAVEDEPGKNSRFIVKIVCRNGMTTKYRLPFEVSPPVHARFNMEEATNHWTMGSRTLRQLMDHFGPGIEYLDIHADDDQIVNFTCFTEKIAHGDEVLKKPLHTSIAVERDEFENFEASEESIHVVISVKDFRAITQHAAPLNSDITANYSLPSRPMQLSYEGDGIKSEFLLMTVGDRGASAQKGKKGKANTKGPKPPQLEAAASRATSHAPTPPMQPQPARQERPMLSLRPSNTRPSQRAPPPAFDDDDSLFVPQENDNQWEPVNLNEDEEEENARLEWNASAQPVSSSPSKQSYHDFNHGQNPSALNIRSAMSGQPASNIGTVSQEHGGTPDPSSFEPTQRLAEVRKYGLFGD
ncbi:hypothetical protein SCUP515_00092 [Seiridium cupressi]